MTYLASGWNFISTDEYCSSVRDGTHDSPKPVDSGYPLVTSRNIKGGLLELTSANIISSLDYEEINRRSKVDQWDVLYSMIGTIGEVYLVEDEQPDFAIKNVGLFKCNSEEDGRWLSYWLRSPNAESHVCERLRGSTQQYIPLGELRKLPVPVPQNADQRRQIISVIQDYDDLIDTNRRRIALLEESARLLYREWFVKLRFPGHESVKVVDGVPEGWSRVPLSEIATVNGSSISNKEVPETISYIDIAAVETGVIRQLNEISYSEAPGRARRRVRHGDVIWSCVRPNRKSYALIWNPSEEVIASTGFAVLTPSAVPFSYLYLATTTEDFVAFLTNRATGATYPAVTAKDFQIAKLLLPSTTVLNDFHARVEPSFALQECLKMQNNQLAQARDALLPKLMSGQLAV